MDQVKPLQSWWTGPDDLSALLRFQWDDDYLYLAAQVIDDVHFQPSVGGSTWLGDSIQIAFAVDGRFAYELTLARTADGDQVYAHRALQGETGLWDDVRFATRRIGQSCFYEAAIPWSRLAPLRPEQGQAIRMNFIVNDNDGAGRLGYLEARPGIGEQKRADECYDWPLHGPRRNRPEPPTPD
ncbi:sugar-binding protein [Phycisphaerales bacterium AB-hyl4]|uniref:Sugar-binding protein n=1 Tax=Natronomicrosphaera hydrolytica TaxID=3242702 RepID=A0ABV4U3B2_9BACT